MTEDVGSQAAGLLVGHAWNACLTGRPQEALSAADRAVEAATRLDDLVLLVQALDTEAQTIGLLGDYPGGLARYTRILGLAEDPATRHRLDHPGAVKAVARAHWNWVGCARHITSIPVRDLFRVLDAADQWLAATGHRDWGAAILLERAEVHALLAEWDAGVACAQEALAVKLHHPDTPGFNLASHRRSLGGILIDAGRPGEADRYFHAALDDPAIDPWELRRAHVGLAECALAAGDLAGARREARRAVQLAEPLGDDALCTSLGVLTRVCRAEGDLDAAWQAATRRMQAAERIGGHYRPYQATLDATDIALDLGDHVTARQFLHDLDQHARAMDDATATTTHTTKAAHRHQQLTQLENRRSAGPDGTVPIMG